CVVANGLVFISGQAPLRPGAKSGEWAAADVGGQTRQCLRNIQSILEELDLGLRSVVRTTVLLSDPGDFAAMNEAYREFFPEEPMRLARSFPDHTISVEAVIARYDKAVKGESFADRDYIIQEKSSGKPIGWGGISIQQWTRRATAGEIGLAIAEKAYRAKGLGTEVVGLLLREAFEQLNLH